MGRIDISPRPEHMRAMGPAFGGADGLRKVAFPLHARLAVLDAGNAAVIVIALDACWITESVAHLFQEQFAPAIGIPAGHILLCASHSHTAPPLAMDDAYAHWTQWVLETLRAAVPAAWAGRRPARAGAGYGYRFGVCFNRRLPQADTRTKFVRDHIEGRTNPRPIDPNIGVLRIDEASGKLMGVLMNFAAHPATLINHPEVSPDFPGFMCDYVERRRSGAVAAFLQGGLRGHPHRLHVHHPGRGPVHGKPARQRGQPGSRRH